MWDHKHFYCEESLLIVARHLGFSNVEYVEHRKSKHDDLVGLDARLDQRDLSIYVAYKVKRCIVFRRTGFANVRFEGLGEEAVIR